MKAHVYVTLKASVLDPQGQTIQNALRKIGFADVTAVRQGKYFALSLADGLDAGDARTLQLFCGVRQVLPRVRKSRCCWSCSSITRSAACRASRSAC